MEITKKEILSGQNNVYSNLQEAKKENKDWALYNDMRKYGPDVYDVYVFDIVRGKAEAHSIEREQLKIGNYKLNSKK